MKKQVYLIPNVITAFALACGLFVIFKINMVEPGAGNYHVLFVSILILLLAALADFLDGAIARIFEQKVNLDSCLTLCQMRFLLGLLLLCFF